MKIPKSVKSEHKDLSEKLRSAQDEFILALEEFNEYRREKADEILASFNDAMRKKWQETVETTQRQLNVAIENARSWAQETAEELEEKLGEKSDSYRESDRGLEMQEIQEHISDWGCIEIEELECPESSGFDCEDVEPLETDYADSFDELLGE